MCAQPATFTTNALAIADAFVAAGPTGNLRTNNYGGGGALAVAAAALPNGEFQSVLRFDLSGVRAAFDAQFGAGQWSVLSIALQLSSSPHSNPIYNDVAAGRFSVSLMTNSTWVEGTGNASNPGTNGITFQTLQTNFISPADQPLGAFAYDGGTNGANSYALALSPNLLDAVLGGSRASLRLSAADNTISYLFSSRSASPSLLQPQLLLTAAAGAAPPPNRILAVRVGTNVVMTSVGAGTTWLLIPEFTSNLVNGAWAPVPGFTNSFIDGTNTTVFNRLDPICGPNVFLRLRQRRN